MLPSTTSVRKLGYCWFGVKETNVDVVRELDAVGCTQFLLD